MALHLPAPRRATYKKKPRALAWPHPLTRSTIHPDLLTLHGFHHTPTIAQPALTTCFLCDLSVDWSEGDDPSSVHLAQAPECGWAVLRSESWEKEKEKGASGEARGKDWDWKTTAPLMWPRSEESFPGNERMGRAREMTFSVGWPAGKGVPTSEEIAKAGWYFRPGNEEDEGDRCVCAYCERAVEGWEKGDDPLALHQRKLGLHCPFFLASAPPSTSSPALPAPRPTSPAPTSRATRLTSPVPTSRATRRNAPASETDDAPPLSRSTRGRNAPTSDTEVPVVIAAKGRKAKRGKKVDEPEETVDEEPPVAPKSKPKSRGKKVEAPIEVELSEVEEEEEKPKSKSKAKARSKAVVEVVPEVEVEEVIPVEEEVVPVEEEELEQDVEDAEMEEVVHELEGAVEEEEMVEDEVPVVKKKGKTVVARGKKGKKAAVVVHEDVEDPDDAPKASKPTKKAPTTNKASKPTPPLTPTASLSPRPILSLPKSPARAQPPFASRPNPFHYTILTPSAEERKMTVGEWYDFCGRRMYEGVEKETREEVERFEERVGEGRKLLERMVEDAERREGRRSGRTPRA